MVRKINTVKDRLYSDGFYDSKIVLRKKTITTDYTDPFEVEETVAISDYVVDGIVEYGSEFVSYGKTIETINGDAKMTVRQIDKDRVFSATEIWLRVEFDINSQIKYQSASSTTFTMGTQYEIGSSKPSIYGYDEIFILKQVGKLNVSSRS
jgi:hypothetical protein